LKHNPGQSTDAAAGPLRAPSAKASRKISEDRSWRWSLSSLVAISEGEKYMPTKSQLEANRRNAQKSTGPKTETGKETVGRNAIKHGLTAARILVLPEEQEEYDRFREALREDWYLEGATERLHWERFSIAPGASNGSAAAASTFRVEQQTAQGRLRMNARYRWERTGFPGR
jgi:hypothetical protein